MNVKLSLTLLALLAVVGCSNGTSTVPSSTTVAKRAYNGTASVGDFLSISVDPTAKTIAYTNHSNGDSGTASYTVNANGSYALSDPSGNLVSAYEIPGYALVIAAKKVGPDHATSALVTAVESGPISVATFENQLYNYMQLRTAAGGFEAGSISFNSAGSSSGSRYWPYGAFNMGGGGSAFGSLSGMSLAGVVEDPAGAFFTLPNAGSSDYVFGTSNGQFLVDTPNGSILGLKQAATSAFDPAYAGTYGAIAFQKTNANTGPGNVETGTAALKDLSIAIDASAHITVTNTDGTSLLSGTLTPVAGSDLVGSGKLGPCPGMFTFRVTTASSQQDVLVAFQGRALIFATFTGQLPASASSYDYAYGVGLH